MRPVIRAHLDAVSRVVASREGYIAKFYGRRGPGVLWLSPLTKMMPNVLFVASLEIAEVIGNLDVLPRGSGVRVGLATGLVVVGDASRRSARRPCVFNAHYTTSTVPIGPA